jgi:hypothetical protein
VVGPVGPQTVGQREIAIEMTHLHPTNRGQLMDDHVRPRVTDSCRHLIGIKRIRDDRHSA